MIKSSKKWLHYALAIIGLLVSGQVDLAETDGKGNENEKGNGHQEGYKCGVGRRPCEPTLSCKIAGAVHPARDLSQAQDRLLIRAI